MARIAPVSIRKLAPIAAAENVFNYFARSFRTTGFTASNGSKVGSNGSVEPLLFVVVVDIHCVLGQPVSHSHI
jgi:hypothetical protein